jgi:phage shock protein PspC (stress-responsive transcriptional regulator)
VKTLYRLPDDGRIAGVCAGMAHYLNADVTLVRLVWLILSILPGAIIGGVIAYIAAWVLMPVSSARLDADGTSRRLVRSATDRKIGGVCGGLAEYFHVDSTAVRVAVAILTVYPGAIVFGIIAYAIAWLIIPQRLVPFATASSTARG